MDIEKNKHYELWPDRQAIDIIKNELSHIEYTGFLKGNILKYQLRLGKKGQRTGKDLAKIKDYTKEYEERNRKH